MSPFRNNNAVTSNPFSASRLRPDSIPFIFRDGETADDLAARFIAAHCRGEIIGPHGTGKSTLLVALRASLAERGVETVQVTLRDRQRSLPPQCWKEAARLVHGVLIIDGYEQLRWSSRLRVRWFCWRRKLGLLVTAHQTTGLPVLYRTAVDGELAAQVVNRLLMDGDLTIARADVEQALAAAEGNLREALFRLYDLYESNSRAGAASGDFDSSVR